MKRSMFVASVALATVALVGCSTPGVQSQSAPADEVYLTYELRDTVTMEAVRYENRYGIELAGHLFKPADFDPSQQYPAIVIGTPYGGVKEQGAGIYAMNMAERGFIALAFDESYNGESGGEPRDLSAPGIFVEDFSAGVDYLGTRPYIDRDRIGAIGICGAGGFALTAAEVDPRIKAIATTSMYDISVMHRYNIDYSMTDEQRNATLERLSQQRWDDFENGTPALPRGGWPTDGPAPAVPEGLPPVISEFFEYYGTQRGWHPNTIPNFTLTSGLSFINFPLMTHLEQISPRPILMVMGENAHSRLMTEQAFERAAEPKELVVIPDARHIDLYDREDMIPFDKLDSFFSEYL
ncbi:alpha/beta hydrolase [Reinekea blandensis]|uniref:Membrane protein n=1 Tax=Reinekea blandensis MED297 TaxID=314283 RepID=A4BIE3_9GAMM|nr:alpha/beta hydrolase [Reinekea blandensis]EAR08150.1 membrane protein [Reinekea sp. MED297] [Reinekea blandensis MED297]